MRKASEVRQPAFPLAAAWTLALEPEIQAAGAESEPEQIGAERSCGVL